MLLQLNGKTYSTEELLNGIFSESLSEYERNILRFCSSWLRQEEEVYTLHTSGSTGIPKPIRISRAQMETSAKLTQAAIGLNEKDRALVCMNTDYIAGKMMLVRGMIIGMDLTIISPVANPFLNLPNDAAFDFTALVPLQMETILKDSPDKISSLNKMKGILIGGAPVSLTLEERIQKISAPVFHTFGMTETISHIALRRLNGKNRQDYFEALKGVSFELDDRGCLIIHSPLTNEPVITNDLTELIDEYKFIWKGRIDNVINSGGIKVYPELVEKKLEKLFNNLNIKANYFTTGLPDERLGKKICLIVEEQKLSTEEKEKIRSLIPQKEWGYETPRECYFITNFAFTSTGKINKNETLKKLL